MKLKKPELRNTTPLHFHTFAKFLLTLLLLIEMTHSIEGKDFHRKRKKEAYNLPDARVPSMRRSYILIVESWVATAR